MSDPFEAAGALRTAYRQIDWAASPLGPVDAWSPALRTAVSLIVPSRIAATLLWGPEFVLLYNEAYVPILAEKHPAALGRPAREVFPEVWPDIEPLLTSVFTGQGTVGIEDFRLLMERHHTLQESYFTFSYSAVAAADGTIEGVLDLVTETTAQVLGHRRLALLTRLTSCLADIDLTSPQDFLDRALPVLRAATDDFTTVDIHLPGFTTGTTEEPDDTGEVVRVVTIPLAPDGRLVVRLNEHLLADAADKEFVALVATTLEQSLSRIRARQIDRLHAEALQTSLLTAPAQVENLQVAVRYRPAAEQAQVGGDWYDAFRVPDGCMIVVVGDVTGHDRHSAAAMAQLRNLTRGIAYTQRHQPALILGTLDAAMSGLGLDTFATAVLARVETGTAGAMTLSWSNAGHPPPLLLHADGTVEVLHTSPETLLGMRVQRSRSDHTVRLEAGASVVFYTDGLIERRHTVLDEGLTELAGVLTGQQNLDAEQICDRLLDHFGYTTEDDIVLAVIHAWPPSTSPPSKSGSAT